MIQRGEWNVARAAADEYDLEGKTVGIVAAGRIGRLVMERLRPFGLKEVLYFDYQAFSAEQEKKLGCRRVENLEEMVVQCGIVDIHCPLFESTYHLFDEMLISKMKKGRTLESSYTAHTNAYRRILDCQHSPWRYC
jgi:formate dehydrogenase